MDIKPGVNSISIRGHVEEIPALGLGFISIEGMVERDNMAEIR